MLVKNWMTTKVVTIQFDDTLSEAINTLKRNKIRRMPVMKGNKLVGIVSDRDLKEASPSKATSLDIWEVHYLMSKIKVKDVMIKKVITISPDATVEKAAILMFDNRIGGLPVVENKELVGIITEQDIFNALISVTGARIPSYRVSLLLPDTSGSVKEICELMNEYEFKCISILTTFNKIKKGKRKVILRFKMDRKDFNKVKKDLEEKYGDILIVDETKAGKK